MDIYLRGVVLTHRGNFTFTFYCHVHSCSLFRKRTASIMKAYRQTGLVIVASIVYQPAKKWCQVRISNYQVSVHCLVLPFNKFATDQLACKSYILQDLCTVMPDHEVVFSLLQLLKNKPYFVHKYAEETVVSCQMD